MNKLTTNNTGGHPLMLDDFDFIQKSIIDMLNSLMSWSNGFNGVIVKGCDLYLNGGTGTYWINPGYVYIAGLVGPQGEIFVVAAQDTGTAVLATAQNMAWNISDVASAPDPVTYANLVARSVHRTRQAFLGAVTFSFPIKYNTTPTYAVAMADVLQPAMIGAWQAPALAAHVTEDISNPAGYALDLPNRVSLKGLVTYTGTAVVVNALLFTLPAGYRPQYPMRFICYFSCPVEFTAFTDASAFSVIVNTDGTVCIPEYPGDGVGLSSLTLDLSSISFRNS